MDHLKPEPLSTAHLPGLEELWGGPAVIRYTNIAKPRDKAAAAHRLFSRDTAGRHCLDPPSSPSCGTGASAASRAARLWTRRRRLSGCPISCCGRNGAGALANPLPAWRWMSCTACPPGHGLCRHGGEKRRQHLYFGASGLCAYRRPSRRFSEGGAGFGPLGLRP